MTQIFFASLIDGFFSVKNDRSVDIRNRPRIPVPDEDPYSVAGKDDATDDGEHDSWEFSLEKKLLSKD